MRNKKSLKSLCIVFICSLLSGCYGGPVGNANVPQPAKAVDLAQYVGRWYEIARYENGFEKGCEGVTADYPPVGATSRNSDARRPLFQNHAGGRQNTVIGPQ